MISTLLSKNQLHEVIAENRYKLTGTLYLSSLDELTLIEKAAKEYGFHLNILLTEKIVNALFIKNNQHVKLKEKYDGAVIYIRGEYSVIPEYLMNSNEGFIRGRLFVHHETQINRLHRELVEKLIEEKAVELFPGCDMEYLYEAISETTENYLFEKLAVSAKNLPIYRIIFDDDGTYTLKEMGFV